MSNQEVNKCKCWSDKIPTYFSSIGTLCIGLAAIIGVKKAPEVVQTLHAISILNQKQSQSQSTTIILPEKVIKEMKSIVKSENGTKLNDFVLDKSRLGDKIQDEFFLAPEYKDAAIKEYQKAIGPAQKEAVLLEYYDKSVKSFKGSN